MRPLPPSLKHALLHPDRPLPILVLRLAAFGDILRTIPAVRLLKAGIPHASIRWIVDDRWRGAVEGLPELDGVVELPRKEWQRPGGLAGLARSPAALLNLRRRLRQPVASLLLDFHGNLRSGMVGVISGAGVRIGHAGVQQKEGNRYLTTHRVPARPRRTPRMERNLDLIRALALPDAPLPAGELPLVHRGRARARELIAQVDAGRRLALVNPGASAAQAYKKPPAQLLGVAARELFSLGLTPLVVWGPGEEEDARRVVAESEGQSQLAPPTDLATLAALTGEAALFVGGDSGPMHLACLLGCPVIAFYGGTDPLINAPWGVAHRTIFPPGRRYTGIKRIDRKSGGFEGCTADQVREAVHQLLRGRPSI